MKIRLKKTTRDSDAAVELFQEFRKVGNAYMTFDYTSKEYQIEVDVECESEAEQHRLVLQQLYYDTDIAEEQDALQYADAAIKTLIDMGMLECFRPKS